MIEIGQKHTSELTVTEAVTANSVVGSGDMPVLTTPMMLALMENAAMLAAATGLPEGSTTVGTYIETSHLKPSKIGARVRAEAEVTRRWLAGRLRSEYQPIPAKNCWTKALT